MERSYLFLMNKKAKPAFCLSKNAKAFLYKLHHVVALIESWKMQRQHVALTRISKKFLLKNHYVVAFVETWKKRQNQRFALARMLKHSCINSTMLWHWSGIGKCNVSMLWYWSGSEKTKTFRENHLRFSRKVFVFYRKLFYCVDKKFNQILRFCDDGRILWFLWQRHHLIQR